MTPSGTSSDIYLSKRGKHAYDYYDFLITYLGAAQRNPFHPKSNPNGIINFGTAVNRLMQKELEERLRREDVFNFSSENHQHYYEFNGKPSLRTALANFFNRYMNVAEPINSEELVIMSGTAACLDALAHTLFDPNDIYLTPTPTYGRIFTDFNDRSQAIPIELELEEEPADGGLSFRLTSDLLEKKIVSLAEEGKTVKGFVLINPQNPLGDVYSPTLLRELLEICAKYKIHVIIDEVYILTMCGSVSARSVMSLPNLPDPQRTHVVWALTKDFCLAGFRVGTVWTRNAAVRKVLENFTIYNSAASIIQDATTTLLSDFEWLDKIYFPRNRQRLQENRNTFVDKLKSIGAVVRPSQAGLYVWFHLKKYLRDQTTEAEMELFDELFDAGVYIAPGSKFFCKTPGWFRMVFAVSQGEIDKGIEVMNKILRRREISLQKMKIASISRPPLRTRAANDVARRTYFKFLESYITN